MESFHFELTLKNNYHSLASSLSNVSSSFIFLPTLPIFFFLCFSFLFLLLVSAFSFLVILCSFWLYFRSLLSTADGPLSAFSRKDFLILAPLSDFFLVLFPSDFRFLLVTEGFLSSTAAFVTTFVTVLFSLYSTSSCLILSTKIP